MGSEWQKLGGGQQPDPHRETRGTFLAQLRALSAAGEQLERAAWDAMREWAFYMAAADDATRKALLDEWARHALGDPGQPMQVRGLDGWGDIAPGQRPAWSRESMEGRR